jgi:small subunit ribosomal protein SAe
VSWSCDKHVTFGAGNYIINLQNTWDKLVLAARAIAAVENPSDVAVIGGRPYAQRGLLKFAAHTGSIAIAGRFTPGMCLHVLTETRALLSRHVH